MMGHVVRALLAVFLIGVIAVPAEAQRRRGERGRSAVEVNVNLPRIRVELPGGVRVIPNDRWYYGSGRRDHHVTLRQLRWAAPKAYRRVVRDHNRLHRDMRSMHPRRARVFHEQWHRHQGWSHREFVTVNRHNRGYRYGRP